MNTLDEMLTVIQARKDGKSILITRLDSASDQKPIVADAEDYLNFNFTFFHYSIQAMPKRVPLQPSDIPAVCWLRNPNDPNNNYLIHRVNFEYVKYLGAKLTYNDLMIDRFEYSEDRKNWKPCWKEA